MSAASDSARDDVPPKPPAEDELTDTELTCDPILRGRLKLWQPRLGYRFSVDSLLLVQFVGPPPFGRVADLGAGVGIIGLALAARDPQAQVTLIELQPRMAALARRNTSDNGLDGRVHVLEADLAAARTMRDRVLGASFDLLVSSPPFFTRNSGRPVPHPEEAIARHELRLTLGHLCAEARRLLMPGGRLALIYPAERLPAVLTTLEQQGLRPVRLRAVYPRPETTAQRVLVLAHKGSRGNLVIDPPLVVRDGDAYTPEAREALGDA